MEAASPPRLDLSPGGPERGQLTASPATRWDGTLARGDDHSNYTHKQEYVKELFEHDKS
jgi:hypothetical protein